MYVNSQAEEQRRPHEQGSDWTGRVGARAKLDQSKSAAPTATHEFHLFSLPGTLRRSSPVRLAVFRRSTDLASSNAVSDLVRGHRVLLTQVKESLGYASPVRVAYLAAKPSAVPHHPDLPSMADLSPRTQDSPAEASRPQRPDLTL